MDTNLRPLAIILVISLLFILISSFMGILAALVKADYLVYTNNSENFIIIRSNNGEKIAVGVDLNKKSLKNKYLIIDPSKDLELTHIHTGRLSNNSIK